MQLKNSCCGAYKRRLTKTEAKPQPPNPKIQKGVSVIYIGAGAIELKGEISDLNYYASDHKRHFSVHPEDLKKILQHRDIILAP